MSSDRVHSPLFAETQAFIATEFERLRIEKIDPWVFLTADPPFKCTTFYGKVISYQGIAFEGSPRDVFWSGCIEPFLQDLVLRTIHRTFGIAAQRGIPPRATVAETVHLLEDAISGVYRRMQTIDQRLRGGGNPDRVQPRPIDGYIEHMNAFIDQIIAGRLARKSWRVRLSDLYRHHPILFWGITTVISVVGLATRCFAVGFAP
jgi:hypothetical protein